LPVLALGARGDDRARKPGLTEVETEIAELVDQSTHDLRSATGSPLLMSGWTSPSTMKVGETH
jgi:hypothetical protein